MTAPSTTPYRVGTAGGAGKTSERRAGTGPPPPPPPGARRAVAPGLASPRGRAVPPDPRPVPRHTFLKDVQRDPRGLAHYVGWVFDVTGESAVVTVVQVVYDNGAVLPAGVPHPLDALFEGAHLVDVGLPLGVVEDL